MGYYLEQGLQDMKRKHPLVREIRGRGLMWGMELDRSGIQIVKACLQEGLIINCTADTVLRFLPPLIVSCEEIDLGIHILDSVLSRQ